MREHGTPSLHSFVSKQSQNHSGLDFVYKNLFCQVLPPKDEQRSNNRKNHP